VEPYRDTDGRITGVLGLALDVTERVRAEQEVQRTLSMLQSTLDSTDDGILVLDGEGHIATFNQRFGEVWHLPPDVLATRDTGAVLRAAAQRLDEPDEFMASVRQLAMNPDTADFHRFRLQDGRTLEEWVLPQRLQGRTVGHILSFRAVDPAE
jgi:PAS domain-containing protein